jgi:hypothetical protein
VANANDLAYTSGKGQSLSMPAWKEFKISRNDVHHQHILHKDIFTTIQEIS